MKENAKYILYFDIDPIIIDGTMVYEHADSIFLIGKFEQNILEYFKGGLSISEISDELSKCFGETYKKEEFFEFCKELISKEIITLNE